MRLNRRDNRCSREEWHCGVDTTATQSVKVALGGVSNVLICIMDVCDERIAKAGINRWFGNIKAIHQMNAVEPNLGATIVKPIMREVEQEVSVLRNKVNKGILNCQRKIRWGTESILIRLKPHSCNIYSAVEEKREVGIDGNAADTHGVSCDVQKRRQLQL